MAETSGRYKWDPMDRKIQKCAQMHGKITRRIDELNRILETTKSEEQGDGYYRTVLAEEIVFLESLQKKVQLITGMIVTDLKEEGAE